ncbi:MAG: GPN-loop GTPase family protein, partial [archaeon]|nr:GPN-loop GTPase family protein [archaeon]
RLKSRPYVVNLDPACAATPYKAQIDIRKTINYKAVMEQFGLGPNGAILTSLNLFATKFGPAVEAVQAKARATPIKYVLVDTPGQIEAFTWSASGAIITDSLASAFPTVIVFVVDAPRSASPTTFMSNMLYACSILYKTQLPMVIAFNKADVVRTEFLFEWVDDFEVFLEALHGQSAENGGYIDELTKSMALVLEEFYKTLRAVSVSAARGDGIDQFFEAVQLARDEYYAEYWPVLKNKIEARLQKDLQAQQQQLEKLHLDLYGQSSP